MCVNNKLEDVQLKKKHKNNVQPVERNQAVTLQIYYRNRILKSLLIWNNRNRSPLNIPESHHVVYQFTCNNEGCIFSNNYIGYTTCLLSERFRTHRSVRNLLSNSYHFYRVPITDLLQSGSILRRCSTKRYLKFAEAILIK